MVTDEVSNNLKQINCINIFFKELFDYAFFYYYYFKCFTEWIRSSLGRFIFQCQVKHIYFVNAIEFKKFWEKNLSAYCGEIYRNIFKMKTKFSTELQSIFIISNIIFFIIWHFLAISCFVHIFHNSGKTLLPWMNVVLIITPFLSPRLILKIEKKS